MSINKGVIFSNVCLLKKSIFIITLSFRLKLFELIEMVANELDLFSTYPSTILGSLKRGRCNFELLLFISDNGNEVILSLTSGIGISEVWSFKESNLS